MEFLRASAVVLAFCACGRSDARFLSNSLVQNAAVRGTACRFEPKAGSDALMTVGVDSLYRDGVALLQIPMEKMGFNFATKRLIRVAHEHNLAVHYWTIDDEADMRYLIEMGADAIMTDNPSVLKKVLNEYKK